MRWVYACTSKATLRTRCARFAAPIPGPISARPEHAARLFEHRRPLYRQAADITLDIRNKSFEDVSYLCAEMLLERGLL